MATLKELSACSLYAWGWAPMHWLYDLRPDRFSARAGMVLVAPCSLSVGAEAEFW